MNGPKVAAIAVVMSILATMAYIFHLAPSTSDASTLSLHAQAINQAIQDVDVHASAPTR